MRDARRKTRQKTQRLPSAKCLLIKLLPLRQFFVLCLNTRAKELPRIEKITLKWNLHFPGDVFRFVRIKTHIFVVTFHPG